MGYGKWGMVNGGMVDAMEYGSFTVRPCENSTLSNSDEFIFRN